MDPRSGSPGCARQRYLGIDLGAETLKLLELSGPPGDLRCSRKFRVEHHKNPGAVLLEALQGWNWDGFDGAAISGRLGRLVNLPRLPLRQALTAGCRELLGDRPATVVSIGSRGFSVLELRSNGTEILRENGRCAQGTGNFLQQLVGRFGLGVEEASRLAASAVDVAPLSGRCPVILKTDMTHLANKGEPKENILAGLLDAIAENVQTLIKPRTCPADLVLAGGVARSGRIRASFQGFADRHGMRLLELDEDDTLFLEALGTATFAAAHATTDLPVLGALLAAQPDSGLEMFPPLSASLSRVRRLPKDPAPSWDGPGDVILGFDIGSTGSKLVAFDPQTALALWQGYVPTDGAPVAAAQQLLGDFMESPAGLHRVKGFGVTGSGREIVGSLLSTCFGSEAVSVLNEIAAHATGALACDPRVDTIFEIGGQDAKYIRLAGGRVVDAAMNEACSAGTGSFIEEQGRRFAGVDSIAQLGELALAADQGAALGQHCSIFMAEVMDEAVAGGVPQQRIIAGIYDSVVANYLNRVKGSRSVGEVVFCQGMPFASDALAAAVARQTGAEVIVPPEPGLMGALGIARLAAEEIPWQRLPDADGHRFLEARVVRKDQFVCSSTQGCGGGGNKCRIERLRTVVKGERKQFTWGGNCSLWEKATRRAKLPDLAPDPFRERRESVAALIAGLSARRGRPLIALTDEFQLQGLLPFFATFLHWLGFDLDIATGAGREALKRGIEEAAVPFCAPMQQYHGLVAEMAETGADYLFLPMIREVPRVDGEAHSSVCPIAQGAPDVLRLGMREKRILSPVVDMGSGFFESPSLLRSCQDLAAQLGIRSGTAWRLAWREAREAQARFDQELLDLGCRALAFCREQNIVPVAVLGRGYTLHNDVLNSNVPAILREQGALAIPLDCLPLGTDAPVFHEVFWGHSQRILRAAWKVRRTPGMYSVFCSNYSCGPDSFTVHTYGWLMEGKPFAIVETDGHAGDAGTKTRMEAFLHCVREDLRANRAAPIPDPAELRIEKQKFTDILRRGERLLVPPMGPEAEAVAAAVRGLGVPAEVLPPSRPETLRQGRRHTSGKECLPMTLTLGSLLERVEREPEGRFVFLMPAACGPCRFGAYQSLHRMILERLGRADQVRLWSPPFGDYFQGVPAGFAAVAYTGLVAFGVLEEALHHVRPVEKVAGAAERIHGHWSRELSRLLEGATSRDLSLAKVLLEVSSGRLYGAPALLRKAALELAAMDSGKRLPKVVLAGEIYVRLDAFANGGVAKALEARGLRVGLEPVAEIIQYSEHAAWAKGAKGGLGDHLERWVRNRIFGLCHGAASEIFGWPAPGPIPEVLDAAAPYMRDALEGETVLSLGVPIRAWRLKEIDGAVLVGPLECMPNKLAEAQLTHVAEREGLLSLTLSLNGEPPDPEVLDNFAFEVRRRWELRKAPAKATVEPA
jgi:predicted CoA-substrate-specific enzyme activase